MALVAANVDTVAYTGDMLTLVMLVSLSLATSYTLPSTPCSFRPMMSMQAAGQQRDGDHRAVSDVRTTRRCLLTSLGASVATCAVTSAAPAVAEAEDPYTVPAGLAKIRIELVSLEAAAEAGEVAVDQMLRMLRSPVFVDFLGFIPAASAAEPPARSKAVMSKTAARDVVERQIALLGSFPAQSRRTAAACLGGLLADLREIEVFATSSQPELDGPPSQDLKALLTSARDRIEDLNQQYYSKGCMVCPEPVKAASGSEEFENPNNRKLLEVEAALNEKRLRRPDYRDEAYARRLGFREGELIGGY